MSYREDMEDERGGEYAKSGGDMVGSCLYRM